jgi:hypothetical protein
MGILIILAHMYTNNCILVVKTTIELEKYNMSIL